MKHFKFLMVALTLVIGGAFTSCMNSDNESNYDAGSFVNVTEFMGTVFLTSDNGITLIPTNPEMLKINSKYVERAFIYYKYQTGVIYDPAVTEYRITIVGGQGVIVQNFTLRPDTLVNSYPISNFAVGVVPGYLNVSSILYYNSTDVALEMYIDTANVNVAKNEMPVILQYTKGGTEYGSGNSYNDYRSWRLSNGIISVAGLGLNPSDSVTINVKALGSNSSIVEKKVKYKFNY